MLPTTIMVIAGIVVAAVLGYFYVGVIRAKLAIANEAIDQPSLIANAHGIVQRIGAELSGWKTVILAWIAGLMQLLQALPNMLSDDMLHSWQQLPWSGVVDAKVANWITIICALLIPLIHAQGVAHAAVTPPVDPGA